MKSLLLFTLFTGAVLRAQTPLQFTITTLAGTGTSGFTADGTAAASAQLGGPSNVAVDSSGAIYIVDQYNNRIRKVSGGNLTTVAGTGVSSYSGDGKAATSATLSAPAGVAVDSAGNLYIADASNYVIRKVTSAGVISTIAGMQSQGPGFTGDGGAGTSAQISRPQTVIVDASNNVYFADSGNNVIRRITSAGVISTVAGNNSVGFSGDGGPATLGRLNNPVGIALDRAGNLYIADTGNNRIRMVSGGTISTIVGTGVAGHAGDGGVGIKAQLSTPKGVAVDPAGNVYISDTFSNRIRVLGVNGIIATIAGNGSSGLSGDGGAATAAQLFFPTGLTVDNAGKIYVADNQNNAVRLLTPAAGLPVVSTGGVSAASAFGGGTTVAPGGWVEIYGSQLAATSRGWGTADFSGSNAPTMLDGVSVTVAGQPAYVDFISAGQVNAQLPSNLGTGAQQLTVTTVVGTSANFQVNVAAVQPGILAPASFKTGGRQYAAALFTDGKTYVAPAGAVAGVSSRAAKAGDVVTFYGVGFGTVTPAIAAGQVVQGANTLTMPFAITFAGVPGAVAYAGLAPGSVGLYQFNVVVPAVGVSDAVPLVITLGGVPVGQTLFTAVGN